MYDIVIRGGHVIDPASGINQKADVAVCGGRIDTVGVVTQTGKHDIDATGLYVMPGLIDYHTHIYAGGSNFAVRPDWMLPTGVTAAVDAGTSGCGTFSGFYRSEICGATVKVKAYISLYSCGQLGFGFSEDYAPERCDISAIMDLCERHRDVILGLKVRLSRSVVGEYGCRPLEQAISIAEKSGWMRVCVHVTDPPCELEELLAMLCGGDVLCHCFHGIGSTILGKDGAVKPQVLESRRRGVLFDVANGKGNCSHKTMRRALEAGFFPDIISTDMLSDKLGFSPYARSLPMVMSKFMAFGMPLEEIVRATTAVPAVAMDLKGKIGSLTSKAYADISIFGIQNKITCYLDCFEEPVTGAQMLVPCMTISNGQIVYGREDFDYVRHEI